MYPISICLWFLNLFFSFCFWLSIFSLVSDRFDVCIIILLLQNDDNNNKKNKMYNKNRNRQHHHWIFIAKTTVLGFSRICCVATDGWIHNIYNTHINHICNTNNCLIRMNTTNKNGRKKKHTHTQTVSNERQIPYSKWY